MDRLRALLFSGGLTLIVAGALCLYTLTGPGRWFLVGALVAVALILAILQVGRFFDGAPRTQDREAFSDEPGGR